MLGFGLSNGLLVAWVVVQPADARLTAVVSTIGGVLVPLLAVPLCFGWPKRWWRTAGTTSCSPLGFRSCSASAS